VAERSFGAGELPLNLYLECNTLDLFSNFKCVSNLDLS